MCRQPGAARSSRVLIVAALALVAAGCTKHGTSASPSAPSSPPPASSAPASSSPPPRAPVLRAPADPVTVIAATKPEQESVQLSQALFASSPAAVVTSPDQPSASAAAVTSQKLGLPLLVADPAATAAVDDEIHRLGCDHVLLVGTAEAPDGVQAVHDVSQLPPLSPPEPRHDTTVLVHALDAVKADAETEAATVAATATAHAAGATVVPVHGSDPRADPAAIDALADAPASHVLAVGADFGPAAKLTSRLAVARTGVQLPGGGQTIFPGRRFVALYGHPGTASLGVLGAQDLDASIARAKDLAAQYDPLSEVPVVPTFEIIATVAQGAPGKDGNYSGESSVDSLRPWVEKASAAGFYVVLDLQPGSADLLDQAKLYTPLLELPDVGLAIDPEWALGPGQRPLQQIGSVDASRINAVGAWLDGLTAAKHLPEKLFVLHQFRLSMIGNEPKLKTDFDNLAVLIHMDGQGTQPNKAATWHSVVTSAPKGVPFGWKNFTKEDHPMLSPEQTMARTPKPMMISYQ